jgi:hypothetical protein
MKRQLLIRAFAGLFALACIATSFPALAFQGDPNESDLSTHGHYINRDGNAVHSPARSKSGAIPQGASARCRDGTYSFSRHHSGTCSRHGGVASWL